MRVYVGKLVGFVRDMVSQKDAVLFADWIQEPVEFKNKVYSKDQNDRIGEYQQLAKFLSNDLKAEGITNFQNVILDQESIMQTSNHQLLQLNTGIIPKLWTSKELNGNETFYVLCMIHNSWVENIKSLFQQYVRVIYTHLPKKEQKRINLPRQLTLGPVMKVLRAYKNGRYTNLFSDINVDLRNAIAHFNISFGDKDISYNDDVISGSELLLLVFLLPMLRIILSDSIMKAFDSEVINHLIKRGWI
jgi:hypothetical protein